MKIMDGLVAFGCALVCTVSVFGQTNRPATPPDGQRYLFVVDISASMRKIDDSTRQALFDLIYFGVGGQMKNGDTFGIWTFNERTYAGKVPMQTWDPEKVLVQASLAAKHLQAQTLEGKSNPQGALARVGSIVRNVKDLNIFLITDGTAPLIGTAFDQQVNPVYEQRAREREKLKKPFVTTFIARGGQVTNSSVTIAGEAIFVPPPSPPQPKEVVLRPKAPGTNIVRASAPRVVRRTNSTPLIIRPLSAPLHAGSPAPGTNSTNAQIAMEAPAPLLSPADYIGSNEALGLESTRHASTNAAKTPGATIVTSALQTSSPPAETAAGVPIPAPTAAAGGVIASNVARLPRATNALPAVFADLPVAAREGPPPDAPASVPRPGISPSMLIMAGALLLAGSVVLFIFGFRRGRTISQRPSFISQSMERP